MAFYTKYRYFLFLCSCVVHNINYHDLLCRNFRCTKLDLHNYCRLRVNNRLLIKVSTIE